MTQPERKALRLKGYDYSAEGYYFVTVCVQDRARIFWDGERAGLGPAPTNGLGDIVRQTWLELPLHTTGVRVDRFVVMPNHFHGIVILEDTPGLGLVGAGPRPARVRTALPEAIRQFKAFSARRINQERGTPGQPVWQRGYYDHIIRNEEDYLRVCEYIETNPGKWSEDDYYVP